MMRLRAKKACAWAVSVALGASMIGWSLGLAPAFGQEAAGALVAGLRANGAEVKPLGRRGALEGWLVTPRGKPPYTLYVDESGHGVMGLLFSPDGAALTGMQLGSVRGAAERSSSTPPSSASRVAPAADRGLSARAPSAGVLEAALAVEGFDLGDAGPQVAIFADPTCLPSRAGVAALARRALAGEIRLRVVPVGARGAEAEAMAGSVLGAEDRARSWFTLDRVGVQPRPGGEDAAGVALNRRLFERTGARFVPYALMREPDGRIASVVGADFTAWFGDETVK